MVSLKAFLIVLALGLGLFSLLFAYAGGKRVEPIEHRVGLGLGLIGALVAVGIAYLAGAL